jgi:hypothetical protein
MRAGTRTWGRTMTRVGVRLSSLVFLCAALDGQAQNLIQNPGFTGDLSGWTIVPSPTYAVAWDGAQGSSGPGSVSLDLPASAGSADAFFLQQCIPVAPSTTYDLGGSFRYPGSVATVPVGNLFFQYFANPACTDQLLVADGFGLSGGGSPADTWLTADYPKGLTTPPGTVSARLNLRFTTFAAGAAHGWFDDVRLSVSPLAFFVLEPCRVLDTRGGAPIGGPVMQGQETRTLAVAGICGIPSNARALSINLTVTQPSAAGHVVLFATGPTVPTVSNVNYVAGQTRANNATVSLNRSAEMAAFVGQTLGSTVHVIIDANGYFQ